MKIQQSSIERATVFHGQNSMRSLRRPPRSAPTAVKERFRGLLRDEGIAELEAPETNRVPRRYYREFRDTTTFAEPAAALDLSPFVLAGVAVPYDSLSCDLGGWRERIMPGAFADAIRNRTADTLAVVEHDTCKLFGRLSSGTLKLTDLPDGVHVTVDLPSTSIASDLFLLVQRRDLSQMSFAFLPDQEEWTFENGVDVRNVLSAKFIDDVSVVANPAYTATHCEVSTRGQAARNLARGRLDAIDRERYYASRLRLRRAELSLLAS